MTTQINNQLGKIDISEEAIATIAGSAISECYGVLGMASRKFTDGLAELLRRDSLSKGIEVRVNENKLEVDLYIIVVYGVKISEVAKNVMEKVGYQIRNITGLDLTAVNVIVQGVRIVKGDRG